MYKATTEFQIICVLESLFCVVDYLVLSSHFNHLFTILLKKSVKLKPLS